MFDGLGWLTRVVHSRKKDHQDASVNLMHQLVLVAERQSQKFLQLVR